jgi:hypothetical protein
MKTKQSTLKKLRKKSLKLRIKKKQKNQFLMKMEMRFHKKEETQFQRAKKLHKLLHLRLRIMNGQSLIENLKIYPNFL